jgi:phosphatidylglycerol:prolipoprotein diacylglycerol transferase
MAGARLFHIFYEAPEHYRAHPWAIFHIWEGGFVFLAGVLCGLAFGVWWLHRRHLSPLVWLDFYAPVLALGYSLGRWACFFQGCCYGRPTDSIWGLHSEYEPHALGRYPTQFFASFGEVILFFILLGLQKQKSFSLKPGQLFAVWMLGHGINRMGMEVFRDDPRGPLWAGLGVSFWLAAGMVLVGLSFYLYQLGRVPFIGRRS